MSEVKLLMHKKVGSDWVPVEQTDFEGSGSVQYDEVQELDEGEMNRARANIGALGFGQALRTFVYEEPEEAAEQLYPNTPGLYELTTIDFDYSWGGFHLPETGGLFILSYKDEMGVGPVSIYAPFSGGIAAVEDGEMAFCIQRGDGGYEAIIMPATTGRLVTEDYPSFSGDLTASGTIFGQTISGNQASFGTSSSSWPSGVVTAGPAMGTFNFNWSLISGTNTGNALPKANRVGTAHYTNDEEPICVFYSNSPDATTAELRVGGGSSNTHTKISFYTAANSTTLTGTERMVIDSSGNVCVGGTPTAKFHVKDGSSGVTPNASSKAFVEHNAHARIEVGTPNNQFGSIWFSDPQANGVGRVEYDHSTNNLSLYANSTQMVQVTSTGLGIGVSPVEPLHVHSTGLFSSVKLTTTNTGANAGDGSVFAVENATSNFQIVNKENAAIQFFTNNSERMRLDSGGQLGIGVTPTSKLHVVGTTNLNGQVELTSQLATNGTSAMTRDLVDTRINTRGWKRIPFDWGGSTTTQTGGNQTSCTVGGSIASIGLGVGPTAGGGACRVSTAYNPSFFTDGLSTAAYSGYGGIMDYATPHAFGFMWGIPGITTTSDVVMRIQSGNANVVSNALLGIAGNSGYGLKIWQNNSSTWNLALYGRTSTFGNEYISGATNASPIVITMNNHNLQNGDLVEIQSVGGNTAANGTWTVAGRTTNTFQLSGSTGNGAYTSGGYGNKITAPVTMPAGTFRQMFFVANGSGTVSLKLGSLDAADTLTLTGINVTVRNTGQTAGIHTGMQNINSTTSWFGMTVSNLEFYILN